VLDILIFVGQFFFVAGAGRLQCCVIRREGGWGSSYFCIKSLLLSFFSRKQLENGVVCGRRSLSEGFGDACLCFVQRNATIFQCKFLQRPFALSERAVTRPRNFPSSQKQMIKYTAFCRRSSESGQLATYLARHRAVPQQSCRRKTPRGCSLRLCVFGINFATESLFTSEFRDRKKNS